MKVLQQLASVIKTPAGAGSSAGGAINLLLLVILPPVWHWWGSQTDSWRGAVVSVLVFIGSYLGAWLKVVMAKGQKVTTELTSSSLPTLQVEAPKEEPVPAAA